MLRQVFIIQNQKIIYRRVFGKALDNENVESILASIFKEISEANSNITNSHVFFKYRVSYTVELNYNFVFIFVTGLADNFERIKPQIEKFRKEFMGMFEPFLGEAEGELDDETLELFDPTVDIFHKNLRPKISLVGFSGVGKTTITRLIKAEDIPMEHVPTITGDIGTIKIGKLHFNLWDFAGQEQFSFLWNKFIDGSDAVLLITDSTIENVDKSRYFTELVQSQASYAYMAVIANKQDLPEALNPADIERILKKKTYSMIATDPTNRSKMIQIIADVLEISDEVSELLKPLKERDDKLKKAEEALSQGDLQKAADLFEELSDLSYELGDDRLSQNFLNKSHEIRNQIGSGTGDNSSQQSPTVIPPVSHPGVVDAPSFIKEFNNVVPLETPSQVLIPPKPGDNNSDEKTNGGTDDTEQLKKELRVQIVKVNKTLLEFETQNIMGELDDETYANKVEKLNSVKARIQQQIDNLS